MTRNGARREWAEAAKEELFLPFLQTKYREAPQSWYSYLTLVVRGTGEARPSPPPCARRSGTRIRT